MLGHSSAPCPPQSVLPTLVPHSETSGDNSKQQIFQNEDLQPLIIHTQSVEALCPDKQTSTVASVQPAAGLALIQARGNFCLN